MVRTPYVQEQNSTLEIIVMHFIHSSVFVSLEWSQVCQQHQLKTIQEDLQPQKFIPIKTHFNAADKQTYKPFRQVISNKGLYLYLLQIHHK